MNTHLQKIKFTLFPPTKFPCSSKVSIHPDYKCCTKGTTRDYNQQVKNHDSDEIKNYDNQHCRTGNTKTFQELKYEKTQPRRSSSFSTTTKVNQEEKSVIYSHITTATSKTYSSILTQKSCPTLIGSSVHSEKIPLSVHDITFNKDTLSAHTHQKPLYNHPNHHDKREIFSTLKRCMLPFKIHYELEWPIPNHSISSPSNAKKTWLQLDDQTSNGIERVRKLGFTDLDVRLDDSLTLYINSMIGEKDRLQDVVIQVLFDHKDYGNPLKEGAKKQARLLRLRRVHWWSTSYNLARTFLPIHW